ncbi:unnamed protein product [Rotaria sordida]|uniref:Uncharacterized protein n=1 Tax=Rotaria sordida TaxID=392033 RepID=A0A814MJM6_9BILA|nr:unnamed protein product [Rotaria sordida]CAF1078911.1 unnamed protein product [Rotaria sordida]
MSPEKDQILSANENEKLDQSLSDNNHNIVCIKKNLFTKLCICIFILVLGSYLVLVENKTDNSGGLVSLVPVIAVVIYYLFGLVVAYKQHRFGLLIFALIGVILFIGLRIFIDYIILTIIVLSAALGFINHDHGNIVVFGILIVVVLFIMIVSLKFYLNLTKLIKTNQYPIV